MKNPFRWIDARILGTVERVSHGLQRTFGLRSQKTAQLCYGGFIATVVGRDILLPLLNGKHPQWISVAGVPVFLLVYCVVLPHQERNQEQISRMGLKNYRKVFLPCVVWRLVMLFLGSFNFYLTWNSPSLYLALSCYFEACDDLPPGMSRVRKWLNDMAAFGRKPVEVTNA